MHTEQHRGDEGKRCRSSNNKQNKNAKGCCGQNLRKDTLPSSSDVTIMLQPSPNVHDCSHTRARASPHAMLPYALGVGIGTIEMPLTITPLLDPDAMELASPRETVVVVAPATPLPALLLLLARTREESVSGWVSRKVTSGPATIALLMRSTAPPFRGWSSEVTQMATGPLMPEGTTHWLKGREMEKGMPPASIWQWNFCGKSREKSAFWGEMMGERGNLRRCCR